MAKKIKLQERRHPDYKSYVELWKFYNAAYRGGRSFAQSYLSTHRLENAKDFATRKGRAYFLNYCRPIPNIYTEHIYRTPVSRPALFADMQSNIDGRGTDADAFFSRCATLSSVYGQVHVLVDKPRDDTGTSAAEAKKPYGVIYTPEYLLDWSRNQEDGELNWALLHEPEYGDDDPTVEREELHKYRVITREGWELYQVVGKKKELAAIDAQPWPDHVAGHVPLVTCVHRDVDMDMVGESMLVDIAPINLAIMNWCSCIDEQIERQTFSQLVMPDDGEVGGVPLDKLGTSTIFTFPKDSKFSPAFISPDTSQLETIWKMVERHVGEIYRIATLEKSGEALTVGQSGIAKAYEFVDTNGALVQKALNMERFEQSFFDVMARWMGKDECEEKVAYNKDFDVSNLEKEIKNALDLVTEGFSDTFTKLVYKRLVRRVLTTATQEDLATIDKEIEEANTSRATEVDLEDNHDEEGDGLDKVFADTSGNGEGEGDSQGDEAPAGAGEEAT